MEKIGDHLLSPTGIALNTTKNEEFKNCCNLVLRTTYNDDNNITNQNQENSGRNKIVKIFLVKNFQVYAHNFDPK